MKAAVGPGIPHNKIIQNGRNRVVALILHRVSMVSRRVGRNSEVDCWRTGTLDGGFAAWKKNRHVEEESIAYNASTPKLGKFW